jgi:hypothetical protein
MIIGSPLTLSAVPDGVEQATAGQDPADILRRQAVHRMVYTTVAAAAIGAVLVPTGLRGQAADVGRDLIPASPQASCDYSRLPGVVWVGTQRRMALSQFAQYAAPVYWFSPDEPTMDDLQGTAIRVPAALPFEEQPDAPVVYYQYNNIGVRIDADGPGFIPDATDPGHAMIDLQNVISVNLKYIAYFPREEGLGGHQHDVEPAEFRIWVVRNTSEAVREYGVACDQDLYLIAVQRVTGEAHGLAWYFNVLNVDEYTVFPFTLIVEEGKHAMCTDKNGDGYFTPGFDVNSRVNDAWGVRDIIRQGALFTGGYEAWMAKVRRPEHRVFPPLPQDSPLRGALSEEGVYAPRNAVYELRPFPAAAAAGDDELLHHKMAEKEKLGWPELDEVRSVKQANQWADAGLALKSFAISLRADGDLGFSFVFPLLIVKNVEDPMTGGFLVHRMYLKDDALQDFGWMLMYTPSASRWVDTYFAAGVEFDRTRVEPPPTDPDAPTRTTQTDFVMETGLKFRVNITKSPLKFLSFLTEFMGFRAGIKNAGFFDINRLTYVLEFGAGVW